MENLMDKLDWLCAAFGAFVSWYLGGPDGFLYALIALTATDYATGVMAAWVRAELSSSVGFRGVIRKATIFCVVGCVHILDSQFIGHGEVMRDAVISYFLANEVLSIAENAERIGVPFPKFVTEKLAQIRGEENASAKQRKTRKTTDKLET